MKDRIMKEQNIVRAMEILDCPEISLSVLSNCSSKVKLKPSNQKEQVEQRTIINEAKKRLNKRG